MYKNSYNGFTSKHNSNYLSESVFLMTNYIWSRGSNTVQVSNGKEIDDIATEEVQKEVRNSNLDLALVQIIQNYVYNGIAFFGYTKDKGKHHVVVYHNSGVSHRRNELGKIDTVSMNETVTVKQVREMYEDLGDRYSYNYGAFKDQYHDSRNGWCDAELVCITRDITNNKDMVKEILECLGDDTGRHNIKTAKWYVITKWGNNVFNIETHSKRPIYWAEYPIMGCDGEPTSISEEADVLGKRLAHARSLLHESIHMVARPPLLIVNDSMVEMGELAICPDGVTVLDSGVGSGSATGDIRKLYDLTNAVQSLMQYVASLDVQLKALFGLDKLALPVTSSPAETAALQATRTMYMKNVADGIYKYVLDPLIYRMTSLEDNEGVMLMYNSAAANDADKLDLEKYTILTQFVANVAQFDPLAADVMKPVAIAEKVAKILNIDTSVVNSEEDMRRIAAIRLEQQMLRQQLEGARSSATNNGGQ